MNEKTPETQPEESLAYQIFDLVRFILIVLAIVIPIRVFIAQPFIVNGQSMHPTFDNGQYLIVDQISYRMNEPLRGDVVIFRPPVNESKFYIKRVVGMPGETVVLDGNSVSIKNNSFPQGFLLEEPYIKSPKAAYETFELGNDEYFVMGDNRLNSSDSRAWGPLKDHAIIGRAWLRLTPPKKINLYPGDHRDQYHADQNDYGTDQS